jgi:hypothetical protein
VWEIEIFYRNGVNFARKNASLKMLSFDIEKNFRVKKFVFLEILLFKKICLLAKISQTHKNQKISLTSKIYSKKSLPRKKQYKKLHFCHTLHNTEAFQIS